MQYELLLNWHASCFHTILSNPQVYDTSDVTGTPILNQPPLSGAWALDSIQLTRLFRHNRLNLKFSITIVVFALNFLIDDAISARS